MRRNITGAFFHFAGDANHDRTVNIFDFSVLASRFNVPGSFSQGDFNYSGTTEIGDFSILASMFNQTLPGPKVRLASKSPASTPFSAVLVRFG